MTLSWSKPGVRSPNPSLQELGLKNGTDKATTHRYLPIYERYLKHGKNRVLRVLEIGVDKGHSLRMWKEFFPHATIYGLDKNPSCITQSQDRISITVGDVTDSRTTAGFSRGMFDIIIDDGSHDPLHQAMAFYTLWPKLKLNGFYFIEDIYDIHRLDWLTPYRPIVYDTRRESGRYDDVLLVLQKRQQHLVRHAPFVRNLLYHIYPVQNSSWRWNIQRIKNFWNAFTGRKIFMIVVDKKTDSPDAVLKELGHTAESYVLDNDSKLGEAKTFVTGLSHLQSLNPREATFYAHAKGVTHINDEPTKSNALAWADALYDLNLSSPTTIDILLESFATVGALKKNNAGMSDWPNWYFEGTFFWLKHSELFRRNWRNLAADYHGVESYPGRQFSTDEACSLFNKPGNKYCCAIRKAEYEQVLITQKMVADLATE